MWRETDAKLAVAQQTENTKTQNLELSEENNEQSACSKFFDFLFCCKSDENDEISVTEKNKEKSEDTSSEKLKSDTMSNR